jgi:hypothetical protein
MVYFLPFDWQKAPSKAGELHDVQLGPADLSTKPSPVIILKRMTNHLLSISSSDLQY